MAMLQKWMEVTTKPTWGILKKAMDTYLIAYLTCLMKEVLMHSEAYACCGGIEKVICHVFHVNLYY